MFSNTLIPFIYDYIQQNPSILSADFSIPFSWVTYIFSDLSIDINNDHICDHIISFKDSHYGHFDHFGHYGLTQYGPEYGHHWCLWKDQEKCRSPMKAELNTSLTAPGALTHRLQRRTASKFQNGR